MKGKVNCTCGWSWDKSDSSKKDMYICHECGRDNSNNMKNGGDIPQAQEGEEISNVMQEGIDSVQSIYRNYGPPTMLGRLPFNLGAGLGLLQSHVNDEPEKLSDQLGMFTNPYMQAASYTMLMAEKEKENMQEYGRKKYRGKDLTELVPEQEINNKVIDNTYVPKPKIGKIKETEKKIKSKQVPYKEQKEVNKVEIDNTRTNKPRVDTNYKPKPEPETEYKFTTPNISYRDDSFVMPNEVNDIKIDNTYVAKPKYKGDLKNGGWLDNYNDSQVSAPEGFVGDGYSNVGRDSSPAWGGQFQMGGSLPGATGMMYARYEEGGNVRTEEEENVRTKDIPSEGKYAKKTMPSAQTGITKKDVRKKGEVMKLQSMFNTDEVNYVPQVESLKGLKNKKLSSIESAATDEFVNWYSNPETLKKVGTAGYDPNRVQDFIARGLNTPIQKNSSNSKFPMDANAEAQYRSPQVSKYLGDTTHPDTGYIVYDPQATDTKTKSVIGHELSHASGFDNLLAPSLYRALGQKLPEKYHSALNYMDRPEEVYGNFHEMRLQMGLKPGQKIDYNTLNNKMKDDQIPNNFWRNFSTDDKTGLPDKKKIEKIVKAINTVASVDTPQQNSSIRTAKNGGWLDSYEDGGIIKDDRGQWDHPGEITEISGDTMATHGYGDIPLYVVPDKGEPRMVQPNTGTQKFPGAKKFTEYPMAQKGIKVPSPKKDSLLNLTDLTYTPQELEYMNDTINGYCPSGNCLESSRKAYDMTAGKIKGISSSNDIWTNDLKLISTPTKPSDTLVKENPYFRGDQKFGSADSWDIHGAIVKAGGKNIYSQAKGQVVPSDVPVGTVAGWGPSKTRKSNHGERSQGMNIDYDLQPSHHSTESVGYNDKGEPIFYDSYTRKYGTIEEVKKGLSLLNYELENLSVPKSVSANTKENLNKKGLLKNDLTPYSVDINKLISATSQPWAQINEDGKSRSPKPDKEKLTKFAQSLIDNKGELISSLGLTNSEYDRLANSALAISMTESEGGGALGFTDSFGSTKGMTQLNPNNIKNDDRLKSARTKQYKGNGDIFNLTDPYNSAIATMMYLSVADKDSKRLYDKGLKPGVKNFNQPGFIENFRSTSSKLNKDGVFIDELNKRIPYSQIPGYEDNDSTKVNAYLKKLTKTDKYNFVNKDGDLSLKMKTKGNNAKLTDIERLGYMWQSPNSLKSGDAQGDSKYVSKIKNYYQALQSKKRNGGSINQQDEKGLQNLDNLTNFTNYNTKQPGGWLDTL